VSSATLSRVRDLTASIAALGAEIEAARRVPESLLGTLAEAGCFRMLVPAAYGGSELCVSQALEIIEEVSSADASVGWNVMIAGSNLVVAALFGKKTFDHIYSAGPDVVIGGSHAPKGKARSVDGGYTVNGQWPFASGCEHCSWLVCQCAVVADVSPNEASAGRPAMRLALLPAGEVEVIDTWRVMGLSGTGSHDIRVRAKFCPIERTCSLFDARPSIDGVVFRVPPIAQLGLFIAAVALGIARGSLNDLAVIARGGKRSAYSGAPISRSAVLQTMIGQADATLRAARSLLYSTSDAAWRMAAAGDEFSPLDRARIRATSSRVVELSSDVVTACFRGAGSAALYLESPLQRRLRDMCVLTQHTGVGSDFFTAVGALLMGEPTDAMRI
jgi:indole-3-acetate monooxygenase